MAAALTTAASTQEKLLRARAASSRLALLSTDEKNALLLQIADAIEANEKSILAANLADVESSGLEGAMRDRLLLTPSRIKDVAQGVRDVAALPDPIGETLAALDDPRPLPPLVVDEPSLSMTIGINTSPLAGQDGDKLTARLIESRLRQELVARQRPSRLILDRPPGEAPAAPPRIGHHGGGRGDGGAGETRLEHSTGSHRTHPTAGRPP